VLTQVQQQVKVKEQHFLLRLTDYLQQPLRYLYIPAEQYRRHSDRTPWHTNGQLAPRIQGTQAAAAAAAAAQSALVEAAAAAAAAAAFGALVVVEQADSLLALGVVLEELAAGSPAL
jgi:hypothetical protein